MGIYSNIQDGKYALLSAQLICENPIDPRYVVDNLSDFSEFGGSSYLYEGLIIYNKNTDGDATYLKGLYYVNTASSTSTAEAWRTNYGSYFTPLSATSSATYLGISAYPTQGEPEENTLYYLSNNVAGVGTAGQTVVKLNGTWIVAFDTNTLKKASLHSTTTATGFSVTSTKVQATNGQLIIRFSYKTSANDATYTTIDVYDTQFISETEFLTNDFEIVYATSEETIALFDSSSNAVIDSGLTLQKLLEKIQKVAEQTSSASGTSDQEEASEDDESINITLGDTTITLEDSLNITWGVGDTALSDGLALPIQSKIKFRISENFPFQDVNLEFGSIEVSDNTYEIYASGIWSGKTIANGGHLNYIIQFKVNTMSSGGYQFDELFIWKVNLNSLSSNIKFVPSHAVLIASDGTSIGHVVNTGKTSTIYITNYTLA